MGKGCGIDVQRTTDEKTMTLIAHELGHNLNCDHDGNGPRNGPARPCALKEFIMSQSILSVEANDRIDTARWSECSIKIISDYLDSR